MSNGNTNYHEPTELLSAATMDRHRAIVSVMEELEAIDWYQQRIEACDDEDLAARLRHNMEEEMEHAVLGLEWIREHVPKFDEMARRILFGGQAAETRDVSSLGVGSLEEA